MKPNVKNFCGGAFPDWLEVNLTDKCNAVCSWCIEKNGWHPTEKAPWWIISEQALKHKALNICLLGGEPTLYKKIKQIIQTLIVGGKRVWITTNGSLLTPKYVKEKLSGIFGINISIHDYNMKENQSITGIRINRKTLTEAIKVLHQIGANVRLNCNCIVGYIDSVEEIEKYIEFSKSIGADKIRFAELKQDDDGFVDLAKILNYKYGLNDNPFIHGCNNDAVINGMPVNFRQMCGLQTTRRIKPEDPEGVMKKVLYYDGKFYDGWQVVKEVKVMKKKKLLELLQDIKDGKVSPTEAELIIEEAISKKNEVLEFDKCMKKIVDELNQEIGVGAGYCQY